MSLLGDRYPGPGLGPVQLLVYTRLSELGTLTKDEAGAIAHANRGKHSADQRCRYCGVDGRPILQSLIDRGLAERGPEGVVQVPRETPQPGDLPEGF